MCPVTYAARSEERNSTASAISFGSASRPYGIRSLISFSSRFGTHDGLDEVRPDRPGATAFTRTPLAATSRAAETVNILTAAFDAS